MNSATYHEGIKRKTEGEGGSYKESKGLYNAYNVIGWKHGKNCPRYFVKHTDAFERFKNDVEKILQKL